MSSSLQKRKTNESNRSRSNSTEVGDNGIKKKQKMGKINNDNVRRMIVRKLVNIPQPNGGGYVPYAYMGNDNDKKDNDKKDKEKRNKEKRKYIWIFQNLSCCETFKNTTGKIKKSLQNKQNILTYTYEELKKAFEDGDSEKLNLILGRPLKITKRFKHKSEPVELHEMGKTQWKKLNKEEQIWQEKESEWNYVKNSVEPNNITKEMFLNFDKKTRKKILVKVKHLKALLTSVTLVSVICIFDFFYSNAPSTNQSSNQMHRKDLELNDTIIQYNPIYNNDNSTSSNMSSIRYFLENWYVRLYFYIPTFVVCIIFINIMKFNLSVDDELINKSGTTDEDRQETGKASGYIEVTAGENDNQSDNATGTLRQRRPTQGNFDIKKNVERFKEKFPKWENVCHIIYCLQYI